MSEGSYRLHSRFREVANYRNGQGDILFVTTRSGLLAANALLVNDTALLQVDTVTIVQESFFLGVVRIDRRSVGTYDSSLASNDLSEAAAEEALALILGQYAHLFAPESMLYVLLPDRKVQLENRFDRLCAEKALRATEILLKGCIREGIALLKGLGRGLTPAGDDFIAGLLYSLHLHEGWSGQDHSHSEELVFELAKSKNLLVNSFIHQAREGRTLRMFKNFVLSLSQKETIHATLRDILSQGATSGADLLSGFAFGVINRKVLW